MLEEATAGGQGREPGAPPEKRAVPARARSDRDLEAAVDHMPLPAFICEAESGRVTYCNALAEAYLELPPGGLAGRTITEYYADPAERRSFVARLKKTGEIAGRTMRLPGRDGRGRWIENSNRWVTYRAIPSILTVFADVTPVHDALEQSSGQEREAACLAEISRVLASGRPGEPMFREVARLVRGLVSYDRISIGLIDPANGTLTLSFVRGARVPGNEQGTEHAIGGSIASAAAHERRSVVVNGDGRRLARSYPGMKAHLARGLRSFATVPLVADDRVAGTFGVASSRAEAYGEPSLARLERVAALLAPAIEQSRLYGNLERDVRERRIIAEIGRVVSQSFDDEEVYGQFAELASQLIPNERVAVTMLAESGAYYTDLHVTGHSMPGYDPDRRYPLAGTVTEAAIARRAPVLCIPARRREAVGRFPALAAEYDSGVRSFLTAPLISRDGPVGALHFRSRRAGAFSEDHAVLAQGIASQVAGVVASHRRRESERQAAQVNAGLAEISSHIARWRPGNELFDGVADVVKRLVGYDRIGVALFSDEGSEFSLVYVDGVEIGGREQGTEHALEDSLNVHARDRREASILSADDHAVADRFPSIRSNLDAGLKSFLTVPMVADDRVVGTISLRSRTRRAYGDRHLEIVQRVASLLAPALEQARLYENLAREAHEREIIASIGRVISASPNIDDVYDQFADLARQIIPADRVAVTALEEGSDKFFILHLSGIVAPGRERGRAVPGEGSMIAEVSRTERPLLFHPLSRDEVSDRYATLLPLYDAGLRSFMTVPLFISKQSAGALHFFSKKPRRYGDRHVQLADSVASQIAGVLATARARAAEQAAARETAALAELGRCLSRPGETRKVLDDSIPFIAQLLPFERLGIGLIGPAGNEFRLAYVHPDPVEGRQVGSTQPVAGTVVAEMLADRSTVLLNDAGGGEGDTIAGQYPRLGIGERRRSFIAAPLIAEDRVIGAINFSAAHPDAFNPSHARTAERIAAHVAPFMEKARLYGELERESRDRRTLAEIGRVVNQTRDLYRVSEVFAELVGRLIPHDRLSLVMLDGDDESLVEIFTAGAAVPGDAGSAGLHPAGPLASTVADAGASILVRARSRDDARSAGRNLAREFDAGFRAFLSTPLVADGQVVGALHLRSRDVDAYRERHRSMAESIAAQISGVVASIRLREAERRDAEQSSALATIARIISSTLDVREVYDGFAEQVARILPADRLVITTIDAEAGTAVDTFVWGVDVPGWGRGTVHEIAGSPFEHLVKSGLIQVSGDITEELEPDTASRTLIGSAGLRSSLMAPLFSNGRVIGTLNLKCYEPETYTHRHVELAARVADLIAGAIANAGLYDDVQHVADERRALGAIGLAANRDLELDGVFNRAADALREVVEYDRMSITLFDSESGLLKVAFTCGKELPKFHTGAVVAPAPGDPFDGESWLWTSTVSSSRGSDGRLPSVVTAPLGTRSRHLGYIRLRSETPGLYTQHTVELMQRVATYLTPAVQNALEHQQAIALATERERTLLLDRENEELQRLNEAKSRFLSTVSHELKTPLTSMTAFTDILLKNRQGGMTERDLSQLAIVQRNGRRLGNLIDDLLDLSRLDRGSLELVRSDFDAGTLVSEVVDGFKPISDAKGQRMQVMPPGRPVYLNADRDRLIQVLTNLLSNASKYSGQDAAIEVKARRWRDRVYFTVADHGIGISEADQEQLFTLFFRADNPETRAESGTGIGLFIARSIVELHGGGIRVTSAAGSGTKVTFYMPGAYSPSRAALGLLAGEAEAAPWSRLGEWPGEDGATR